MPTNVSEATIAAIATPVGEGSLGVIRLSGPEALDIADRIFESKRGLKPSQQKSFTAQLGYVVDRSFSSPQKVDEAILLIMRSPKSYTTEDLVELSCHGGRIVLQKTLEVCLKAGARLAEPGEFTKRAFLNGRIDLVQAETVLDLVRAKTEQAYRAAQFQLEGRLSELVRDQRDQITYLLSHIEASLDFPDDHLEPMKRDELLKRAQALLAALEGLIRSNRAATWVKEGLRVVLAGKPNVGKSSLMNALLGRERVIVSQTAGTTRDSVEESLDLAGYAIRIFDTAGLRDSQEPLERESVKRSQKMVEEADLVLFVVDASSSLSSEDRKLWENLPDKPKILVCNKSDLLEQPLSKLLHPLAGLNGAPHISTSCRSLQGIDDLKDAISSYIEQSLSETCEEVWVFSVRQRDLFTKARDHVALALRAIEEGLSGEFVASDLKLGQDALGEIVGEVVTDDILDLVFSQFCVGK